MGHLTCDHCLLPFPERDAIRERTDGEEKVFCCEGCRGIYFLIRDEGLGKFYERRTWEDAGLPAEALQPFDPATLGISVKSGDGLEEMGFFVGGIRCSSCVWLNERILMKTPGVEYARINFATHRATVRWKTGAADASSILRRIHSIGYHPSPSSETRQQAERQAETRDLLIRFGTAAFLSSQLMIYTTALYAGYFQGIDESTRKIFEVIALALTLPVLLYSGAPFLRGALRGLRQLHFTMDSLIITGAYAAFFYSVFEMTRGGAVYFDTAAMIITLILLGRYLEARAKGRASETLGRLAQLQPAEARLWDAAANSGSLAPLGSIRTEALIQVLPGERIPLDGVVVSGETEVDESLLTGESKPVRKCEGMKVIGGSINRFGSLVVRVTASADNTVLAGIIRSVEEAQERKPRVQIFADRVVGYFVPLVLLLAFATTLGHLMTGRELTSSVMAGISVIVIACPCSLGLATPLAILVFTTVATARGILVRNGNMIERAAEATHVVFDKTGTITAGTPSLKDVILSDNAAPAEELLRIAASVEALSEHSIAKAITSAATDSLFACETFAAVPGKGVKARVSGLEVLIGSEAFLAENDIPVQEASPASALEKANAHRQEGDTVVHMAIDSRWTAAFVISDRLRESAAAALSELKATGRVISVISGDNRNTTAAIARELGISEVLAEVSPQQKLDYVHELRERGAVPVMVGDGINDAPALTEASVGIAMGRGTDIAMESADVILMRNDLLLLPWFLSLASKSRKVIRQNVFWAFFYNVIAIPLAVSGMLHPIVAAAAMAASSLVVVVNSLRIRKGGAV